MNNKQACASNGNGAAQMVPSGTGKAKLARIPLSAMYERTDKRGRRYLSGRIGLLRLLVFRTDQVSEGDPVWEAILVEGRHISSDQRELASAIDDAAA